MRDTLTQQTIERLEAARAEQWRQRRDAEGSRDAARAACDSMRIERDAMRKALRKIAAPRDCGCSPVCQCNSQESLEIEIDALKDIARGELSRLERADA